MTKGQRIKQRRESLGFTQTEFAEKIGVSKQNLYKYENDIITNIPSDIIEKIALILNCSPSYLMGWTDDPNPDYTPTSKDHLDKALMEFMGKLISNQEDLKDYDRFTVELPIALTKLEKEIIAAFRQADLVDQNSVLRILGLEKREVSSESKIS